MTMRTSPSDKPAAVRIDEGRTRGQKLQVSIDGEQVEAYQGESLAGVLMANGSYGGRRTPNDAPRGYYCGMGVCWDCAVVVDGVPNVRACRTYVRDGMRVERQAGYGPVKLP
jgi:predicted molibdopterin-dependent oxidoreductase YjgC